MATAKTFDYADAFERGTKIVASPATTDPAVPVYTYIGAIGRHRILPLSAVSRIGEGGHVLETENGSLYVERGQNIKNYQKWQLPPAAGEEWSARGGGYVARVETVDGRFVVYSLRFEVEDDFVPDRPAVRTVSDFLANYLTPHDGI